MPTRIGADVLGGRLPGNLCHCRQATSAVRRHWVTVRTKDKDHARDEEFRSRRSSYLEQLTSRPANHNSLPLDVRSTPVRLIDSAPEDYLGRALQIYSSSSSS